ncbi:MAG: hypothetical protein JRN15_14960 [Nitrososphaerota archaeon]|nr:hypothetical protein [Nitrososphaerota archaeon]
MHSYSGKITTKWQILQRREDRIRTAAMSKGTWHNLFILIVRKDAYAPVVNNE